MTGGRSTTGLQHTFIFCCRISRAIASYPANVLTITGICTKTLFQGSRIASIFYRSVAYKGLGKCDGFVYHLKVRAYKSTPCGQSKRQKLRQRTAPATCDTTIAKLKMTTNL